MMNSCQPQWNQSFIYSNVRPPELRSRVLEVTVWDYDRFGSNEFLGENIQEPFNLMMVLLKNIQNPFKCSFEKVCSLTWM